MIALLIDVLAAWLVARYTQPGWNQMLAVLAAGWLLAAFADAAVLGLAFGWPPIDLLSLLTIGLLVHPPIVGGLAWLIAILRKRMKRRTGTP